jgi:hypothetical protein
VALGLGGQLGQERPVGVVELADMSVGERPQERVSQPVRSCAVRQFDSWNEPGRRYQVRVVEGGFLHWTGGGQLHAGSFEIGSGAAGCQRPRVP